ncbi:glycoside hydrolase family 38 C-terminal domain-containing protein [Plantactinospora sp. BB1]|uniref:glycoside hydrolase family 38 N-terminal domain-containing protein n=1 Tax=Plantactinospora sp. BB1 TaxID=2071627 RepID=UPI000D158548|nr:glycoside hydrolase family 38 C-terminal domain-containing protein [Plantactinospora sp. BB1]AVT35295.1 alpha-mannosidase [Plantactinospora sp. BB1]
MTTDGRGRAGAGVPASIVVVPHTHWDREWYEPFQRFRLRLVALLDEVFERMERDPRQRFTLDGQLAAVDDYLEVRPERRDRVAALVAAGRLAVGPWQILLDEFLCSGENIVRNLELGLRRAAGFGAAMPVGYLPDMFGHVAQMPQILAGAGLAHACVWRGVPDRVRSSAFAWTAPDGTTIRTEYLHGGYGNAAGLVDNPALVARRAAELAERLAAWRPDDAEPTAPMLAMYGADHGAPAAATPDLLAEAAERTGLRLRLGTLTDYFAEQPTGVAGLPEVRGELRSHARANILPGVYSVRAHLKQAMGRAERCVERYAEPLRTLWFDASAQRFLDMAWIRLIEASCHDSVTGCGCDETAEQVATRIAEAEQLGRAVHDLVGGRYAAGTPRDGYAVFNPTPRPRTALVRLDVALPGPGAPVALHTSAGRMVPTQRLAAAPTLLADDWYDEADLPVVLARLHGTELYGQEVTRWSVSPPRPAGPDGSPGRPGALTFHVARHGDQAFDVAEVRAALAEATAHTDTADTAGTAGTTDLRPAAAEPHGSVAHADPGNGWAGWPGGTGRRWRVRILAEPRATVAALVEVPALGWTSVRPVPADGATRNDPEDAGTLADRDAGPPPARAWGRTLDNGLLRVEVADDGTLGLHTPDGLRVEGLGRIVDGGDVGDSYNYAPPATDSLVDKPQSVRTAILHEGPVTAVLDVLRTYRWPVDAEVAAGTRSVRTESVTVATRLELRAAEPFLRVTVSFDNRSADHRVRAHLPLPSRADVSYAQGQFAVVARGLTSEGGSGEVPLPTYPAAGFVTAGGAGGSLAVLLTQPSEYELVDDGRELALTLLRSVGMLSRNRNSMRDEPAGPQVPTPSAQCRGERTAEFALLPFRGGWHAAGVPAAAEAYRHGFLSFAGTGPAGGAVPPARTGLSVAGGGVVLSSVRDRDGLVEVRVVAEHPADTVATLGAGRPIRAARRADLLGRPGAALSVGVDGSVRLPLRAWEIATVQLELATGNPGADDEETVDRY